MGIIDKIFKDKKRTSLIYILLAVGILLLVGGKTGVHTSPEQAKTACAQTSLEKRVEEILSEIEGVGTVRVMIYSEGAGDSLQKKSEEVPRGVVVVADGAKSSTVREKIIRATTGALGVEAHKIEVFERKENQ